MQYAFGKRDVDIIPEAVHVQDRTLVSTRADVHFELPAYPVMLAELADWMKQSAMYT
ncbi:hypothetical protein D3C75_1348070 [compost metagenome]